jgi:hypothetical protein
VLEPEPPSSSSQSSADAESSAEPGSEQSSEEAMAEAAGGGQPSSEAAEAGGAAGGGETDPAVQEMLEEALATNATPQELESLEDPSENTSESESDASESADGGAAAAEESELAGEPGGGSAAAEGEQSSDASAAASAEMGDMAGQPGGGEESMDPAQAGGGQAGSEEEMAGADAAAGGYPYPSSAQAGLESELDASLQVFEGEMARRITVLASADPSSLEGERSGGGGGEFEQGEGVEGSANGLDQTGEGAGLVLVEGDLSALEPGQSNDSSQSGVTSGVVTDSGDMPGPEGTREGEYSAGRPVGQKIPDDVGNGADDDVVARQIREAALNEEDPVLREKLWEEYRNYKKSIR